MDALANTGRPKALPPPWRDIVDEYLLRLRAGGCPSTTIETRRHQVSRLARGLEMPPGDVTLIDLIRFYGRQDWSVEHRRGHRNAARGLFAWAYETGRISNDPSLQLPRIQAPQPRPRPLPDMEWELALQAADHRTSLMLRLAAECGLRRGEVATVRSADVIEEPGGWSLTVRGKGNHQRSVPISDDIRDLIVIGARGHTPIEGRTGYLFPGDDGGHLSPRWVGTICAAALPAGWTLHSLRHRFATRAYNGSGHNLLAVQKLLGHRSVATTQIYTDVTSTEIRLAAEAAR